MISREAIDKFKLIDPEKVFPGILIGVGSPEVREYHLYDRSTNTAYSVLYSHKDRLISFNSKECTEEQFHQDCQAMSDDESFQLEEMEEVWYAYSDVIRNFEELGL